MPVSYERCIKDDDLAKVSLYYLEHKHEMHAAFTTVDMIGVLYMYTSQGRLIQVLNEERRIIGVMAYYHGTQEKDFEDKDVVFVDSAICNREVRGTRLFLNGLQYLMNFIEAEHPEVKQIQFFTLAENSYLCRLYSKFTNRIDKRQGDFGEEIVFSVEISNLRTMLAKYSSI